MHLRRARCRRCAGHGGCRRSVAKLRVGCLWLVCLQCVGGCFSTLAIDCTRAPYTHAHQHANVYTRATVATGRPQPSLSCGDGGTCREPIWQPLYIYIYIYIYIHDQPLKLPRPCNQNVNLITYVHCRSMYMQTIHGPPCTANRCTLSISPLFPSHRRYSHLAAIPIPSPGPSHAPKHI